MIREKLWHYISKNILTPKYPFIFHKVLFSWCYPNWRKHPETAPAYIPEPAFIRTTNLGKFMAQININNVRDFHLWSIQNPSTFWQNMFEKLRIVFHKKPHSICDLSNGVESPSWLPGAKLNIAESCFTASPEKIALIYLDEKNQLQQMTYGELNQLSNRVANSLIQLHFSPGDAIAIDMPMTKEAVAIYLGIIKMGGIVVSIADSFSSEEIATRLRITQTKLIFTQDIILRDKNELPLYEKIIASPAPKAIVFSCRDNTISPLRDGDLHWKTFLSDHDQYTAQLCDPMTSCNILFSSGTTGEPKGIPWNHTTPIKAASDAYLHQNVQENDVLLWPTNLGWMMGPWILFSAFINHATLALYHDSPYKPAFGKFIQDAGVTLLGVVPTLVANWRKQRCLEKVNLQSIKVITSTGECSHPEDMLYLMALTRYKPIIEYCGGTEIGGGYVSSTVIEKNYLSLFTTPVIGMDFILLNENGQSDNIGEVAILSLAMGLSTQLLNANHHQVYFENMPNINNILLRRHGDQLKRFPNGCYAMLGRIDDTMNLSGIKVSSAEIERVLTGIDSVIEIAAIAISPSQGGPSQLIIYAATTEVLNAVTLKKIMQEKINLHLNPLFKIHDIIFVRHLPKTASNKIMRRTLRDHASKSVSRYT